MILSVVLFAVYLVYLTVQKLPTFSSQIQSSVFEDWITNWEFWHRRYSQAILRKL